MKRITFLMTGLLVLMLACDNPVNNVPEDAPDVFRELVKEEYRIDANKVNAEVYATFVVENVGGNTGSVLYILGSEPDGSGGFKPEPANFPGKGKVLPGECIDGKWYNSQGKPTAGSHDKPHPHCVDVREGTESYRVVLEKISAVYKETGNKDDPNKFLELGKGIIYDEDGNPELDEDGNPILVDSHAKYVGNNQQGNGIIVAWGIREGTTDRVGHFTIDLGQFNDNTNPPDIDLFDCTLSGDGDQDGCLNKTIVATYRHGIDGDGDPENVEGFLYWFMTTSVE